MSAPPPALPQPNWWSRNWKWFVPVLAATALALFAGFIALIFSFVFGMMRSSEPYQTAVTRLQASTPARSALGEPIEAGFFVTGNVATSGAQGSANLAIPVSGPRGKGQVFVVASKELGQWHYEVMAVKLDGHAPINLLTPQESQTPPSREDGGVVDTPP